MTFKTCRHVCWGLYNCLDRYSRYLRTLECDINCTKNSSKLKRLGSSLSHDFPCPFTHHNFANRLRDKINEAVYCNRILQGSPKMPSGKLVGTTLKLTTGREVTEGHSHFPTRFAKLYCEFCSIEQRPSAIL